MVGLVYVHVCHSPVRLMRRVHATVDNAMLTTSQLQVNQSINQSVQSIQSSNDYTA